MANVSKSSKSNKNSKPKSTTMQKIGKGIKDAFVEMSESLAGWIDDTGTQFSKKKNKTTTVNKTSTTNSAKSEKPKLEPEPKAKN